MSSILKALKKVEQEKSSRIPELLKIDSDILKTVDSSRRSASYTSLLVLLVFGGGAAAYYFMNGSKAPQPTAVAPQAVTIKTVSAPVSPVVTVSSPVTEAIQARTAAVTARKATAKAASSGISGQPEKPDMAAVREPAANAAVPALRVNGIAYQGSAADSMAIVNGTAVSNGSVIEGITVVDVRKDRVLFQYNGERFEIQLGQSNQ